MWRSLSGQKRPELEAAEDNNAEAESLFRQGLRIQERALSPNHTDIAENLRDLATLLQKLGRDEEAAELSMGERSLRRRQRLRLIGAWF